MCSNRAHQPRELSDTNTPPSFFFLGLFSTGLTPTRFTHNCTNTWADTGQGTDWGRNTQPRAELDDFFLKPRQLTLAQSIHPNCSPSQSPRHPAHLLQFLFQVMLFAESSPAGSKTQRPTLSERETLKQIRSRSLQNNCFIVYRDFVKLANTFVLSTYTIPMPKFTVVLLWCRHGNAQLYL